MKVVVCVEKIRGDIVSFEELKALWGKKLSGIDGIDEICILKEEEQNKETDVGQTVWDNIYENADAILGMKLKDGSLSEEFLTKYPKLKYAATFNHGFGNYDREAVNRHGVTVTNTIYGDVTVAQFAMALLLNICHDITANSNYYKKEHFDRTEELGRNPAPITPQMELYGKTLGIIGLGSIGLWMARMAAGFGMRVIANSRHPKEGKEYEFIEQMSMEEVIRNSDVISIHCPLTEATRGMINKRTISWMKDGVILINTARGDIIVEEDLIEALNSGKIRAAGLDVVSGEPVKEKTKIFNCKNAYITPHMAWLTKEAVYRQVNVAVENFRRWIIPY